MAETVSLTFVQPDGLRVETPALPGQTLLEIAQNAEIDIEGACGGSLACATCHLIVDTAFFDQLPPMKPDERAMLDMMAIGLQPTSRLGCQLVMTKALDGLVLYLPSF